MQRRKFIALAGGGIVLAATATAAQGSWFSAALPDAAVEAWYGSRAGLDPVKTALSYAITAPNPHNLQPWIADLRDSGVIRIYTDPSRILPHTDPLGRQITIGHGAFLELLVMALAAQGLAAEVQLWPEGELPAALGDWQAAAPRRPVAMLKLTAAQTPSDPLFAQVLRRRTVKADFDATRAVSAADLQLLLGAAGTSLKAAGTVDSAKLGALRELCWQAAQVEINTERTVMESIKLVRVGPGEILQHRDGITVNTPSVRMLATLGLFDRSKVPAPGSAGHKNMSARFDGHSRTAMGFAWLSGPNTRAGQIAAGRAHVRMHLKATELGIGLHPMSQALQEFPEMQPHYARAHELTLGKPAPSSPNDETLHMLNRIGYTAEPSPASPRRPLAAFIKA
jgi:hypothetical protein